MDTVRVYSLELAAFAITTGVEIRGTPASGYGGRLAFEFDREPMLEVFERWRAAEIPGDIRHYLDALHFVRSLTRKAARREATTH